MGSALWCWSGDWTDSSDPSRRRTGAYDAGQSEPTSQNHRGSARLERVGRNQIGQRYTHGSGNSRECKTPQEQVV
jgi:hypothetical protein